MRKLFKFLKPYGGAVLAILCVLIVQAYCDLSLPTYTSDIVNIGIQQKGIDEKIPYEISEEDFGHLLLFVTAKEQETVKNAYEESQASYEYDGTVMELKETVRNDGEKLEELSKILGKPMLLCAGFDSGSESAAEIEKRVKTQMEEQMRMQAEEQMRAQTEGQMQGQPEEQMQERPEEQMQGQQEGQTQSLPEEQMQEQLDIYGIFGMMEDVQREAVISEIEAQFSAMPETMAEQSAAVYIENVYQKPGIDIYQKEINYILKTGGEKVLPAGFWVF